MSTIVRANIAKDVDAGRAAARACKACDQSDLDGIAADNED
jgi:hypothetical protein